MSALSHTLNPALQRLGGVSVRLSVELGRTQMALKDVLSLAEASVVTLDRLTDELLDITANGQVIAHGEVIAQDGKFALRIVSLAGGDEPVVSPPKTKPSSGPMPDVSAQNTPTAPEVPPPTAPRSDSAEGDTQLDASGEPSSPSDEPALQQDDAQ
ncbi:MAG: FliM/FliN family flagellar motor switch protein [Erythrobacter sp.]